MRKFIILVALALACVFLCVACGGAKRFVTTTYWWNEKTFFVAYTEEEAFIYNAKVIKCDVQADNTVKCAQQDAINSVINPK